MTILEGVLLGLIQGIAEFLPISSSGHLVLFEKFLGIKDISILFNIILHVGTLIPVLIVYKEDILKLLKKPNQKMTYLLVIGTIPAVIVGLFLGDKIEILFNTGKFLGIGFIITGLVLTYADKKDSGKKIEENISIKDALFIGTMQSFAILPAVSRSGSTIAGGLFRGINKEVAAKFSFLLSIPAIGGALVLQLIKMYMNEDFVLGVSTNVVIFSFLASALSGYLAINFMLYIVKKSKLEYFAYYVFFIGVLVLLDQAIFNIYFTF